jgi:hypothetical protein
MENPRPVFSDALFFTSHSRAREAMNSVKDEREFLCETAGILILTVCSYRTVIPGKMPCLSVLSLIK